MSVLRVGGGQDEKGMSIRGFGREEGRKGKKRRTEARLDLVLEPPSLISRGNSVRLVLACDLERRLVLELLGESVGAQDESCGVGRVVVFEVHGVLYAQRKIEERNRVSCLSGYECVGLVKGRTSMS